MNSRQLVVIYAVLAFVVVLFIPVPIHPWVLAGGAAPRADDAPRCLTLEFSPDARAKLDLPTSMRLRSQPLELGRRWFNADGRPRFGRFEFAAWRPAGRDSIDIMWHHSPLIRVPVPPQDPRRRVVGRMTSMWDASLVTRAMFQDTPVTAWSTPCAPFDVASGVHRNR